MATDNTEMETFDYSEILAESDKAWLLMINNRKHWMPRKCCRINEEENTIRVPVWLMKAKQL